MQEEFDNKCVYCLFPDLLNKESFCVEHYRPKNQFKELETVYTNLFYSCHRCNCFKGTFWPNENQIDAKQFIPNPCDYVMFDHLRYNGVEINEHSEAGKFASERLHLNSPIAIKARKTILMISDAIKNSTHQENEKIKEYKIKISAIDDNVKKKKLENKCLILEKKVENQSSTWDEFNK